MKCVIQHNMHFDSVIVEANVYYQTKTLLYGINSKSTKSATCPTRWFYLLYFNTIIMHIALKFVSQSEIVGTSDKMKSLRKLIKPKMVHQMLQNVIYFYL